jgi:NADH:ubiquinone oxidoreductase subunit
MAIRKTTSMSGRWAAYKKEKEMEKIPVKKSGFLHVAVDRIRSLLRR